MATTTYRRMYCPHCNHRLVLGFRRFGPPQVRCKCCNNVINTDLENWHDPFPFPGRGRFLVALAELINPSWLGVSGSMGFITHWFAFAPLVAALGGMIGIMPVMLSTSLADISPVLGAVLLVPGTVIAAIGLFAYPLLMIRRLILHIRESKRYEDTQTPPVWG